MDLNTKLSPHFKLKELIRSDKAIKLGIDNTPPAEVISSLARICVSILEPVQSHFLVPFSVNSGYRCPDLNKALGGSKNSQHMLGQAVDFEVPGISNFDLAYWISKNLFYDQLILENYESGKPNSGWVHVSLISGVNRMQLLTIKGSYKRQGLIA